MAPCHPRRHRSGLNARPQPNDQLQINIEPQFNYDSQLQGLRDDVKKIKQVRREAATASGGVVAGMPRMAQRRVGALRRADCI